MDDAPEEENDGQETSNQQAEPVDYMNVQKFGQEESVSEKQENEENAADAPMPYPVENARHNYAVGNGSPQGIKLTAAMGDKPVQKTSLKEKLAAFKAQVTGTDKADMKKVKGKEETL